ncbi:MAG TPA: ATP-binding protein [Candidatus Sumerlaeota bacterium]|nr:ATP-binding protein [Candidatus Sumerlaeota bacterium]
MKYFYLKILSGILLIILVHALISSALIIRFLSTEADSELRWQLFAQARTAVEMIRARGVAPEHSGDMDRTLKDLGRDLETRITIILPDGRVYADSSQDSEGMENHKMRIEVQQALMGRTGSDARISPTLGLSMFYLAIPVFEQEQILCVVRVALPRTRIREKIYRSVYRSVIISALIAAGAAVLIGLFVANTFSRPIHLIREAAVNISQGDFGFRLKLHRRDELHQVAEALNEMSGKLGRLFDSVNEERGRIAAIISGMADPLLLIGQGDIIELSNDSFCLAFGMIAVDIRGKKYWEVIRERDVSECLRSALDKRETAIADITCGGDGQPLHHFCLSASPLLSEHGAFRGVVAIFHDMTPIREMETMRRQFVDNASHELKTPISAILASAETLLDRDPEDPATRKRFYQTLMNNATRLSSLIDDLLSLSEIEQTKRSLDIAPTDIPALLKSLVNDYQPAIVARGHTVAWDIAPGLPPVRVNARTLSRAVGNILANAVRYTENGGTITLRCRTGENRMLIEVEDTGIGIPAQDIDRIFERFYRVDKARSIKLGGTGLGLSIARHIVEAHSGRITVTSAPGKGSIFTIHLPM